MVVSRCIVNLRATATALQYGASSELVAQVQKVVQMFHLMLREGPNTQKLLELPLENIKKRGYKSPFVPKFAL